MHGTSETVEARVRHLQPRILMLFRLHGSRIQPSAPPSKYLAFQTQSIARYPRAVATMTDMCLHPDRTSSQSGTALLERHERTCCPLLDQTTLLTLRTTRSGTSNRLEQTHWQRSTAHQVRRRQNQAVLVHYSLVHLSHRSYTLVHRHYLITFWTARLQTLFVPSVLPLLAEALSLLFRHFRHRTSTLRYRVHALLNQESPVEWFHSTVRSRPWQLLVPDVRIQCRLQRPAL